MFELGIYYVDCLKEFYYILFVFFVGGVKEFMLEGFKYLFNKYEVEFGLILCISNEFI